MVARSCTSWLLVFPLFIGFQPSFWWFIGFRWPIHSYNNHPPRTKNKFFWLALVRKKSNRLPFIVFFIYTYLYHGKLSHVLSTWMCIPRIVSGYYSHINGDILSISGSKQWLLTRHPGWDAPRKAISLQPVDRETPNELAHSKSLKTQVVQFPWPINKAIFNGTTCFLGPGRVPPLQPATDSQAPPRIRFHPEKWGLILP